MGSECKVYVRSVDGTTCYIPLDASPLPDGSYHIHSTLEFDAEDTSTLLEFFPDDDVRATTRALSDDLSPVLLAVELVRSSREDRDYWAVLFSIAWGCEFPRGLPEERLAAIAVRIRRDITTGKRWHYPGVVKWAWEH